MPRPAGGRARVPSADRQADLGPGGPGEAPSALGPRRRRDRGTDGGL